jgi:hypothetical protein
VSAASGTRCRRCLAVCVRGRRRRGKLFRVTLGSVRPPLLHEIRFTEDVAYVLDYNRKHHTEPVSGKTREVYTPAHLRYTPQSIQDTPSIHPSIHPGTHRVSGLGSGRSASLLVRQCVKLRGYSRRAHFQRFRGLLSAPRTLTNFSLLPQPRRLSLGRATSAMVDQGPELFAQLCCAILRFVASS